MASEHPLLILVSDAPGQAARTRWFLDQPSMIIGRHPSCEILLPDRQISRQHARFLRTKEGFTLEDLGSKNGTFLNGEPVTEPRMLTDGDNIQVGLAYHFTFVDAEATAPLPFDAGRSFALRLDEERKQVWVGGHPLDPPLSPAQFEVLRLLAARPGAIIDRDAIIQVVWGLDAGEGVTEQAIDALVRRLRRRLAEVAPNKEFIVTVRGHGFRLEQ
jgi:hypothetical protein